MKLQIRLKYKIVLSLYCRFALIFFCFSGNLSLYSLAILLRFKRRSSLFFINFLSRCTAKYTSFYIFSVYADKFSIGLYKLAATVQSVMPITIILVCEIGTLFGILGSDLVNFNFDFRPLFVLFRLACFEFDKFAFQKGGSLNATNLFWQIHTTDVWRYIILKDMSLEHLIQRHMMQWLFVRIDIFVTKTLYWNRWKKLEKHTSI